MFTFGDGEEKKKKKREKFGVKENPKGEKLMLFGNKWWYQEKAYGWISLCCAE